MARRDYVLLSVPAVIGGIIILAIFFLDIQLANFQNAYFRELANETRRNNALIVRACRELIAANELDKIHRLLNSHGPNPVVVRIIARGRGTVVQTEDVPAYLAEHIREPEIRNMFKRNRREDVLVRYDRPLDAYMVYHCARFRVGAQDYILVMASKCSSMTLLMRQTRQGILILTVLGLLSVAALVGYFCFWIRSPLNRLFSSMSRIAAGELEYPVFVPRRGLIREIALCLRSLTERLRQQIVSLQDDAAERKAILNALTEAILLIDADGKVEQWNRTAVELFYPGDAAGESTLRECPEELRDQIRRAAEEGVASAELPMRRGDREFILLVNTVSFNREGGRFYLVSVTDLTEIRRFETYRSEFIAAVSHEMKTPLTGIIGAVDAINAGALDHPDYRTRCIETLSLQSERLHTLLQNFLSLTSLDALRKTGEENDFLPVRPLSVVRSAVEVCRPAAEAAGIEIAVGECVPIEIFADSLLLQQALNNLISNAVFHSGTKRIEVSAVRTGDGHAVDFCVRDSGCGIAPEHQERIFNRFYRVPSSGKKHNGSGIGLAIVKRIAQFHRGRVFVDSRPGEGAAFHLELPL